VKAPVHTKESRSLRTLDVPEHIINSSLMTRAFAAPRAVIGSTLQLEVKSSAAVRLRIAYV
jgi:hypothetical protein